MTDSRLQQLKRAWEASGSVEDEAAYLRERVRVGELSQKELELAAYCGNGGAQRLSECLESTAEDTVEFMRGLLRWGAKPAVLVVAEALALQSPGEEEVGDALWLAREWFNSDSDVPDERYPRYEWRDSPPLARTIISTVIDVTQPFYVAEDAQEIDRAAARANWSERGHVTHWKYVFSCKRGFRRNRWVHRFYWAGQSRWDLIPAKDGWCPPPGTRTAPAHGELSTLEAESSYTLSRVRKFEEEHPGLLTTVRARLLQSVLTNTGRA